VTSPHYSRNLCCGAGKAREYCVALALTPRHTAVSMPASLELRAPCITRFSSLSRRVSRIVRASAAPLVSVVIPTFNSSPHIRETVGSVLNQDYDKIEIIVADDGSRDDTTSIVQAIAESDHRVRLLRLEHSGRPSVPRNRGAEAARGELIAFLDSDDLWAKSKVSMQVNFLQHHHDLRCAYSASVTFGAGSPLAPEYEVLPLPWKAARTQRELSTLGNTIPCSAVIMENSLFRETGGFDEDPALKAVEDYEYWLRIAGHTPFGFIPRLHVFYRVHSGQTSGDWELKAERLEGVRRASGLNIPHYRMGRTKGLLMRTARGLLHLSAAGWYRLLGGIAD
jgi:GT2 family glycosyltransferase